jgi:cytochrome P450
LEEKAMPTRLEDVPKELIVDFDVQDPTLADSVHERLAALQEATPIAYCAAHGGYWLVTRYEDAHEVVRNYEVFSSTQNALPFVPESRQVPLEYDPPEHTAYRQLLNPLFSPARMKALEADIRDTAKALLDRFADAGSCEFVSSFAHPLPTATFLSLMGWPMEDEPLFTRWSDAIIVGQPGAPEEDDVACRMTAAMEVLEYFGRMVHERRANPDVDDVTGALLRARYGGERPLTDEETMRSLLLLMLGGLHTVRGVLSFGMIHLSNHPEQRQRLVDDPSLIPAAVEELLRLDAPVAPGRVVVQPVTLNGVDMQPGDRVVAFLSAANRDGSEFECPHAVQVNRPHNRHLTFSAGPHRCVGSNLARVELAIALEEIHRRIPDYQVEGNRPPTFHHSQVRGVRELHLTFTAERR